MTQPGDLRRDVILGLDVGTTAVKAVAFRLGPGPGHTAVREYPLLQPSPGWQVQDPGTVAAAVLEALRETVAAVAPARCVGIAVSTAMHGLVALDGDAHPVTPLVTWADGRAADEARGLRAGGHAAALHHRTGTPVHPMSPLTKLMWFARHEPVLFAQARWWVGLKDLVLHLLTGTLVTELSSASATGLLNARTRAWDVEALELAGVSVDQLPPVRGTTESLPLSPSAAVATGLPAGTPVVLGAGDGPLGNLGTGAMAAGTAGLSLGTSGAVRMVVPESTVDPSGRLFCYALTDDRWVVGGAVSNGGIVARWAGDVFGAAVAGPVGRDGPLADEALLLAAGATRPGADDLLMVPYLLPERSPLWDPDVAGAFLGVRRHHTAAHFVRAAVEGVCLQLSAIVDELDRISPVKEVRATGGALRAPLWRTCLASALDRPVLVTTDAGGSALGAAALGLVGLGLAPDLESAAGALAAAGPDPHRVPADPAATAALDRTRHRLREHLESLLPLVDVHERRHERRHER